MRLSSAWDPKSLDKKDRKKGRGFPRTRTLVCLVWGQALSLRVVDTLYSRSGVIGHLQNNIITRQLQIAPDEVLEELAVELGLW